MEEQDILINFLLQDIQLKPLHAYKEYRMKNGVSTGSIKQNIVNVRQVLKYYSLQDNISFLPEFKKF